MAFEYAIVLTGGIATGKSSTIEIFSKFGFEFIDADKVAHEILDEQSKMIVEIFGEEFVKDFKVDRKALGILIFSDLSKKIQLEALLHPLIYSKIKFLSEQLDRREKTYFLDIPLFFETKRYLIEKSIVVYTPQKVQLQRLMKREGYSFSEAQKRIDAQMDIEEKRTLATYIIDNSGSPQSLQDECVRIRNLIK